MDSELLQALLALASVCVPFGVAWLIVRRGQSAKRKRQKKD